MMENLLIREAVEADAAVVTRLLTELDCAVNEGEVQRRLLSLVGSTSDCVLLAEDGDAVVGLLGMHLSPLLHRDSFARLTAFIVTESHRGRGIGTALLRKAESWAQANGCAQIELNSGDHHRASHRFYEHMGYHEDDRRFVKEWFD